jgi:hypothetical protein
MFTNAVPEYEKPGLFERLPSPRKRLLGFDRHSLKQLHRCDLIRIIEVTLPGHKYSIELVHVPSLLGYIKRVEELADAKRLATIREGYAHHHLAPTPDAESGAQPPTA